MLLNTTTGYAGACIGMRIALFSAQPRCPLLDLMGRPLPLKHMTLLHNKEPLVLLPCRFAVVNTAHLTTC